MDMGGHKTRAYIQKLAYNCCKVHIQKFHRHYVLLVHLFASPGCEQGRVEAGEAACCSCTLIS